jgi:hypothetical protein
MVVTGTLDLYTGIQSKLTDASSMNFTENIIDGDNSKQSNKCHNTFFADFEDDEDRDDFVEDDGFEDDDFVEDDGFDEEDTFFVDDAEPPCIFSSAAARKTNKNKNDVSADKMLEDLLCARFKWASFSGIAMFLRCKCSTNDLAVRLSVVRFDLSCDAMLCYRNE